MSEIRAALEPVLGKATYTQKHQNLVFEFRFRSEDMLPVPLRLKVEINTREHFDVYGLVQHRFDVASPWFTGSTEIQTYQLDELMGTKLRALYQRRKGRDLFDLAFALRRPEVDPERIVAAFHHYLRANGQRIRRDDFAGNLAAKRADRRFTADMAPLLAPGRIWDLAADLRVVESELIARLED
jgi:predicted nucleotidyltransferase component of viral defense system